MPFRIVYRCFILFQTLPTRRISPVLCRQGYVPDNKVGLTEKENNVDNNSTLKKVKPKVQLFGIICNDTCIPGQYTRLFCPKACAGGNSIRKVMSLREMTEKSLGLEPLGDELIAYFTERMISKGTLQRNFIMQLSGDQAVIAFPFRQNGVLVGCKYRTCREKKFWQEKGTQKWLFGLDDIKEAVEIIIVEGEMDKLAMEEAGFFNCVSVPCGAPGKVSAKELPPKEKDTGYQYLWNCKEHLDKVSRIILATDGDIPGQALAEELARRLGKERCWRVQWPKKDEFCCFKDANEVLKFLGRDALKQVIEKAELYQL